MANKVAHKNTLARVESRIVEQRLLDRDARLLLSVSGGNDSMVLLDIFQRLAPKHRWYFEVLHVNHGLRGAESRRDAEFVEAVCAVHGITVHIIDGRLDANAGNIQEAARQVRYAVAQQLLAERGLDRLLTAHHADDQAELLLMRLASGTGLGGAAGMQEQRDGWLVRPLLQLTRQELEAYGRDAGIGHVEDRSNRRADYRRNRYRHEILPALYAIQPEAASNMAAFMETARVEDDYMESQAEAALAAVIVRRTLDEVVIDLDAFERQAPALRPRLLQRLVDRRLKRTKRAAWLRLCSRRAGGEELHLAHDLYCYRDYARCTIQRQPRREAKPIDTKVELDRLPTRVSLSGSSREVVISEGTCFNGPFSAPQAQKRLLLDRSRLGESLLLRRWLPGDRIRPAAGDERGACKLQDYFTNRKVDRLQRQNAVVVVDRDRIAALLVEPHESVVDMEYACGGNTERCLVIEIEGSLS